MMTYWNVLIISGLVGGVAGGLSVLLFGLLMPKKKMSELWYALPTFSQTDLQPADVLGRGDL
jgi:hypothetical protein